MGVYAAVITSVLGTATKLLGSMGGPSYPAPPTLNKINIQKARRLMENYEGRRMGASIDTWKQRFPLLYQGGNFMVNDLARQQRGFLPTQTDQALRDSGLEQPAEGDQYHLARDIGLNPITLSQRTSQAVTRQIAMNPEWSKKVSGGTLATMIANNYQNQNAFTQFLGANQTAQYVAQQGVNAANTKTLLAGITGGAATAFNPYAPWNMQGGANALAPQPTQVTSSGGGFNPYAPIGVQSTSGFNYYGNASYAAPGQPGYTPQGDMPTTYGNQPSAYIGSTPPEYNYGNLYLPGAY